MHILGKALCVTLIVTATLCGCVTTDVTIKPAVNLPQISPQVQMTVGVYQSPEFRAYESIARQYRFPVGEASVALFQELFTKAIKKVVWIENRPPISTGGLQFSAVIEPQIDEFRVFWLLVSNAYKVWAEIHYGFTVYSPDGAVLTSWTVKGGGESTSLDRAVNYAMQEAAHRFITSFNEVPEAKRWLQGLPQQGSQASRVVQTTRSAPEFSKQAILGAYPGVVTVCADTNPVLKGQNIEVSTRFKESGLIAIRVEIKNQGSHRLLIRHRDITIVRPDGTELSSLPASIFAALGVNPRMKGWTAPSGVGVGALPLVFTSLLNVAAMEAERKEMEAHLSIYKDRELYDTTLVRGKSVQGHVYFAAPVESMDLEDLKLVVPVIDFDSATRYVVQLPLNQP